MQVQPLSPQQPVSSNEPPLSAVTANGAAGAYEAETVSDMMRPIAMDHTVEEKDDTATGSLLEHAPINTTTSRAFQQAQNSQGSLFNKRGGRRGLNNQTKRPVCEFYLEGRCKYGNACHNYHPPGLPSGGSDCEQRKKAKDEASAPPSVGTDEQPSKLTTPRVCPTRGGRRGVRRTVVSSQGATPPTHQQAADAEASVPSPHTYEEQQPTVLDENTVTDDGQATGLSYPLVQGASAVGPEQHLPKSDDSEWEQCGRSWVETVVTDLKGMEKADQLDILQQLGLTSEEQIIVWAALEALPS
ncbi:hypothetical protein LTR37_009407 [Vermiconidia calcicola]|uniref:Uncharacterized protein n=1 Tax=Vermiconidia calcicola TaxID=1690605 RepID=A0ACC3N7Z0_9PEZI|nr:hypothetical protein LTR37_009407 [Vermiconidia calcicola]